MHKTEAVVTCDSLFYYGGDMGAYNGYVRGKANESIKRIAYQMLAYFFLKCYNIFRAVFVYETVAVVKP